MGVDAGEGGGVIEIGDCRDGQWWCSECWQVQQR